ncbi:BQ2448_4947 [Microbotryum intermedium]|uniref:BQ2448_4947 protein n=1 Tax=Microbotryum intermedium TaxID=269621 RepID=A0A238FJR8_9BASI|nr:BQ2448_4947 [Microbotryum intermedium]
MASSSTPITRDDPRSTLSLDTEELRILITNPQWEDELQLATHQPSRPPQSLVNCLRSVRRWSPIVWAHPVKAYCGICLIALCFAVIVRWLDGGGKTRMTKGMG